MDVSLRRTAVYGLLTVLVAVSPALPAFAQDVREEFHKTYPLAATGRFGLDNVNGDVQISVWDRNEVKVDAVKTASSKDLLDEVKIEVEAAADRVYVRTRYPNRHNGWGNNKRVDVVYTVTVPRGARVGDVNLVNGNLTVTGVEGGVEAKTVNGQITSSRLAGDIDLSTVNGRIEAALGKTDASKTVKLGTVNGTVRLALPSNAAARISASTFNGQITNEFSLPMVKGRFVGRSLEGQIGAGGADVRINTVNGKIMIAKTSDA